MIVTIVEIDGVIARADNGFERESVRVAQEACEGRFEPSSSVGLSFEGAQREGAIGGIVDEDVAAYLSG